MSTGDHSSDFELVKIGLGMAATGILGMFGWLGRRQIARIDEIERNYVTEDIHNDTVASLRREIADGNKATHQRLDKMLFIMAGGKRDD